MCFLIFTQTFWNILKLCPIGKFLNKTNFKNYHKQQSTKAVFYDRNSDYSSLKGARFFSDDFLMFLKGNIGGLRNIGLCRWRSAKRQRSLMPCAFYCGQGREGVTRLQSKRNQHIESPAQRVTCCQAGYGARLDRPPRQVNIT